MLKLAARRGIDSGFRMSLFRGKPLLCQLDLSCCESVLLLNLLRGYIKVEYSSDSYTVATCCARSILPFRSLWERDYFRAFRGKGGLTEGPRAISGVP